MEEIAAAAGEVFFDLKADKRNIFIFTSSGKPIFAKCGQDDDLVTTFGFLQAVISIVLNSGDILKSITAGKRSVVFLLRDSLYFVMIASSLEPESILMRELDFLYQQIIFILTKKVHSVLESNPSTDLRNLLGSDSDRILNSASGNQFSSSSVILESVPIVFTNKGFREEILSSLKTVIDKSGAA